MKFIINIYSQVFRVGSELYRIEKFIIIGQCVGFPGGGYSFSFTDVEFHTVSNAPTLYRVNVRLKYILTIIMFRYCYMSITNGSFCYCPYASSIEPLLHRFPENRAVRNLVPYCGIQEQSKQYFNGVMTAIFSSALHGLSISHSELINLVT
jgi:hypothetical protein